MSSIPKENDPLEEGLLVKEEKIPSAKKTIDDVKWQVVALIIAVQANAFVYISGIAYIAFMCIHLVPGLTEENAGSYAGFLNTTFILGRVCTSYAWSVVADRFGRKVALSWSFFLTSIFSISFGFSSNITMAFISRFLLSASDNQFAVIKTIISELSDGDKEFEGRLMGFILPARGWAGLYVPLLSGFLSAPVKQFPDSFLATTFNGFLTDYPFILPNLVGALFAILALLSTLFFIPETRPKESMGNDSTVSMLSLWAKPATRDHLLASWFYSFALVFGIEMVPLFFVATKGGLGLHENLIGTILASEGLVYFLFQYLLLRKIMARFGLSGSLRISSLLTTPLLIFLPISVFLNQGQPPATLNLVTFFYIIFLEGIRWIFGAIFNTSMAVALNQSVSRNELSVMNAFSMIGASLIQSVAPTLSGQLISFSLTTDFFSPYIGIFFTFGTVSSIGIIVSIFVFARLWKYHQENTSS